MKIKLYIFNAALLFASLSFAQLPDIQWQETIGGTYTDKIAQIHQTPDGGYVVGGYSASDISGDKTEMSFVGGTIGYDYWIIKLNGSGTIEWQNTINADQDDVVTDVLVCSDGGYLLCGYSLSGIAGDKTESLIGGGTTAPDFWIIKLNNVGAILWQNSIGGTGADYLRCAKQTADGGFILGGSSYSGISGDKTAASKGSSDYWIVKTDAMGVIEWQQTIGGTLNDDLASLDITLDGGFILGGSSVSPISGDKSNICIGNSNIYPDYWIVKTDAMGNVEWDHTSGGKRSDYLAALQSCADGGYIIGGKSDSRSFGDKSEDNMTGPFKYDYWILKLDADGNALWDNSIGGSDADHLTCLDQANDGGFYFGGYSNSGASFDKSESLNGFSDYWIIKTDATGNIIWENAINGNGSDFLYSLEQTSDGGIILGGNSSSGIGGDKTEDLIGVAEDFWILKIEPETCATADGLYADNITPVKATLHCDLAPGALSYQYWYREIGAPSWIKKSSASNFKTVKSLLPETTYEYKIRIKCSDGMFGEFSEIENFETCALRTENTDKLNNELLIYPNPNSGSFTISFAMENSFVGDDKVSLQILDLRGAAIFEKNVEPVNGKISELISLEGITPGVYLLKCYNGKSTHIQKLIIN